MPRNPPWTRDELILALDLYFEVNPLHTHQGNPQISQLSDLLNKLPIHERSSDYERFRNPAGVYMKLCNFLRLDSNYKGKGLEAGSKLDEALWEEFANDRERLSEVGESIRRNYSSKLLKTQPATVQLDDEYEFPEGRILTRLHRVKERSRKVVKAKKEKVMAKAGILACEVCSFDFAKVYGLLGEGFIECHHKTPLSKLKASSRTKINDLALVFSNCHRMLHRTRPWMTTDELKGELSNDS